MRAFLIAAAAVLAIPATASAQLPSSLITDSKLECLQVVGNDVPGQPSWVAVSRGFLTLKADGGYVFDASYNPQNSSTGTWAYDAGVVTFTGGKLGEWNVLGDAAAGQAMLHDPVKYRRFFLSLHSRDTQKEAAAPPADESSDPNLDSFWNCSLPGFTPRANVIKAAAAVKRKTGLPLALPYWIAPGFFEGQTGWTNRITVQKKGRWRAVFGGKPCPGGGCGVAWISAHRLGPKDEPYRVPKATRLANGIKGYVNTPSCGPGPRTFAVVVCGVPVVTWMRKGVEHAIQARVHETRDLVGLANQVIRG